MSIKSGTTSFSLNVQLFDETNGSPKTGLAFDSAGVNISYARAGSSRVAVTEVTLAAADSAYSSGGFKEIDGTNMLGMYRFDIPNAALVAGVDMVTIYFIFDGVRSKGVDIYLTMVGTDSAATAAALTSHNNSISFGLDSIENLANLTLVDTDVTIPALIGALNDFNPASETVDVGKISGDIAAADNLESMFDGVGYNDPEAPAKQSQLSSLANVGAAINVEVSEDNTGGAIKGITFVGSQTLTYTAAQAADGVYHKIDDATNVIDIVYGFDIGGDGIPTQLSMVGFLNGNNDSLKVFGYDFVTTSWVQVSTLNGKAQEVNDSLTFPLFVNMVGTSSADLGKVYIRFQNTGQSDPDLNIDHLFVSHSIVRRTVGYALGAIWIDTTDGIAGTENYVNGTADNPVLTLADALTIATSLGLSHFQIIGGSTITLASNSDDQLYEGNNWTLVLNGKSISGTTIIGADVSGVCTGASQPQFTNCHFGDATIPPSQLDECGIEGTLTLGSDGTFFMDDCHSGVAGTSTPSLDFGSALNASDVNLRGYSGGIEIKNMGAGTGSYNMSLEGNGQLIINANCSADSTIAIRGNFTITNNASGITISDDARFDVTQIADAMKAITGMTVGGTWTWEKVMRIMTAWAAGNWRVKESDTTKQELLDAENGTTVILEQDLTRLPAAGADYRNIVVKI